MRLLGVFAAVGVLGAAGWVSVRVRRRREAARTRVVVCDVLAARRAGTGRAAWQDRP